MSTDIHEREYLAPKEVAHELRVHVSAVYRAVERGQLPAVRLSESGAIRIPRSVLDPHGQEYEAQSMTALTTDRPGIAASGARLLA